MLDESRTMGRLSLVTVIFLPLTAVATVFGSQFFALMSDDTWPTVKFRVHQKVYLLFVVSVGLTVGFIIIWWQRLARKLGALLLKMLRMKK
jgi:Mg2+ and Co2+ transporter CorA